MTLSLFLFIFITYSLIFFLLYQKNKHLCLTYFWITLLFFNPRIKFFHFHFYFHYLNIILLALFNFHYLFKNQALKKWFLRLSLLPLVYLTFLFFSFNNLTLLQIKLLFSLFLIPLSLLAFYQNLEKKQLRIVLWLIFIGAIGEEILYYWGGWKKWKLLSLSLSHREYFRFNIPIPSYLAFQNPNQLSTFTAIIFFLAFTNLNFKEKLLFSFPIILGLSKATILSYFLIVIITLLFPPSIVTSKKFITTVVFFPFLFFILLITLFFSLPQKKNKILIKDLTKQTFNLWERRLNQREIAYWNDLAIYLPFLNYPLITETISNLNITQASRFLCQIDAKKVGQKYALTKSRFIPFFYQFSKDFSFLGRILLIEEGIKKWLAHPIIGNGSGTFRASATPFCTNKDDCFISLLYWNIQWGLMGSMLFIYLFCLLFFKTNHHFLPLWGFWFIYSFLENIFFNLMLNWTLGLSIAFFLQQNIGPTSNPLSSSCKT